MLNNNIKNISNITEFLYRLIPESKITKEYKITPEVKKDKDGNEIKKFGIGASPKIHKGLWNAIKYSFRKLGSIIASMWIILGALFTGKLGLSSLSGPVGMYTVVGESAKYGMQSIIYLTAYLSVNLAVINALPFPAFDGGRILFVCIEAITRKKVKPNVEATFHTIGFILLMILMLYITIQDAIRLF